MLKIPIWSLSRARTGGTISTSTCLLCANPSRRWLSTNDTPQSETIEKPRRASRPRSLRQVSPLFVDPDEADGIVPRRRARTKQASTSFVGPDEADGIIPRRRARTKQASKLTVAPDEVDGIVPQRRGRRKPASDITANLNEADGIESTRQAQSQIIIHTSELNFVPGEADGAPLRRDRMKPTSKLMVDPDEGDGIESARQTLSQATINISKPCLVPNKADGAPPRRIRGRAKKKAPEPDDAGNVIQKTKPKKKRAPKAVNDVVQSLYQRRRTAPQSVSGQEDHIDGNKSPLEEFESLVLGKKRGAGDRSRVNFVSENLCDDILNRLSKSLEKHKGCDIIDINPGISIWSSKIHDFLKPRTHILMEPDKDFYHPFIQPLLNQPDSTYKLIPKSGILWDNLETATSKTLLPYQEPLKQDDPRREQLNDTLLLIANLGYYPKKSFLGFPSITTLMVHQLLAASRAHSLFHKYGQVRMLIWMMNSEKVAILPKTVTTRKRSSIEAEISCEYIHEVAGSQQEDVIWHREYSVDIESAIHVKEKMKQASLVTPEDRKGDLERQAETGEAMLEDSSGVERRPFFEELEALEAGFASKELVSAYKIDGTPIYDEICEETGKMVDNKKHKLHIRTPEHRRLAFLRYRLKQANKLDSTAEGILKEYDEITDQHSAILRSGAPDLEKISELEKRISDWKTKFDDIPHKTTRRVIARRIEDRRAFRQNPPLLLWDQREAEPLEVSEHDFLPKQEMCLLDFQPKSLWPILLENNLSNYDYFEFLMSSIFMFPTHTIAQALKSVAPGADEWIIPRCPSLMDTTNGGAVSANVLGVRSLNQQMLKEIMDAWMEWPFKPTKGEMVARSGVQSVHNEVDELD